MAKVQSAEVAIWTINELIDATNEEPKGNSKITIPEFQRRLVWESEKEEKLIQSIKSGYPFGSLLLYGDISAGNASKENKRFYKLIDGLQRTQALRKYTQQPNNFFKRDYIDSNFVDIVMQVFELEGEQLRETVLRAIEKWVRSVNGFSETDGWGTLNLTRALITDVFNLDTEDEEFISKLGKAFSSGLLNNETAKFLKNIREEADIGEAKIPVIIYTGSPSELATVFELLNSQGTALSRYEIFAAQWIDIRQKISNQAIIDAIWVKYDAMEELGYTLDVTEEHPNKKSQKTREYSLFEYLFGFGQFISKNYPRLFKALPPDRPSSAGFNLGRVCKMG